jgi:hypothetical protein
MVRDEKIINTQYKLVDEANKEIPALLNLLEKDFQNLLGISLGKSN